MAVEDRTESMMRLEAVLLVALDAKIAVMEDDMFDRLALSENKGQDLLQAAHKSHEHRELEWVEAKEVPV